VFTARYGLDIDVHSYSSSALKAFKFRLNNNSEITRYSSEVNVHRSWAQPTPAVKVTQCVPGLWTVQMWPHNDFFAYFFTTFSEKLPCYFKALDHATNNLKLSRSSTAHGHVCSLRVTYTTRHAFYYLGSSALGLQRALRCRTYYFYFNV